MGSKVRKRGVVVVSVLGLLGAAGWVIYGGGRLDDAGNPNRERPPPEALKARSDDDRKVGGGDDDQILFGDLHVHTTFSADAFMRGLPLLGGEGAHPPSDACDFARYCSQLDFFALTDHAEAMTPRQWSETKKAVRQCNEVAGDAKSPDIVVYTGWEWSQVGITPDTHYGHKNVIFRDTEEEKLPVRPIGAEGAAQQALRNASRMTGGSRLGRLMVPLLDFSRRQRYLDLAAYQREVRSISDCPPGVAEKQLPPNCRELVATPHELFDRLDQWGFDTLVIPHGTTWGFYTPPGNRWDKQLTAGEDDPERQRLIEIYSGHGNSEEYRAWRATDGDYSKPGATCPAPSKGYEPCCWRAGEIIRARCGDLPKDECEKRVEKARADYVAAGTAGHLAIPGASIEDWKDCGQCRDCFNPSFNYRPGGAAQYVLAKGDFENPKQPRHAMLGFIASSDNHSARPGTGYKEFARRKMGEATGAESEAWRNRFFAKPKPPAPESIRWTYDQLMELPPFQLVHLERQASFFMTGGLVAVHSKGRGREAIWDALKRREVYGTSGERMLLWFDLTNAKGGRVPMGSESKLGEAPHFEVRAAGSFQQKPGCPDWVEQKLGKGEVSRICVDECYNPGDARKRITRIEVVRIRPQNSSDEKVETLIDDVWKTLPCPKDREVCQVEFDDPDFVAGARDVLYYVRAIEAPSPAVNAAGLRCEKGPDGSCKQAHPCYGDYRTSFSDDCLSENEERAWSSPIWARFDASAVAEKGEVTE